MGGDYREHYDEYGYAVVKGVFSPSEIRELADAFDRIYAEGLKHHSSFRHQNVFYRITNDRNLGRIMRIMQWPSYIDPVLDRFRRDTRMLDLVGPIIGNDLKQIINQLHWKPPGAAHVEFGYHQDIRFRRPREAYRSPGESYIQTGIAIDPHSPENGALKFYPGSHKLGELSIAGPGRVLDQKKDEDDLRALGLDPSNLVDLVLEPGDVGLWHLHTIHGSGPNGADYDRRLYINGYVTAENCDRGEWTFRDGKPCSLDEPVLVHFEDLYARPEPHYVDA